jgi:hypothetical protein
MSVRRRRAGLPIFLRRRVLLRGRLGAGPNDLLTLVLWGTGRGMGRCWTLGILTLAACGGQADTSTLYGSEPSDDVAGNADASVGRTQADGRVLPPSSRLSKADQCPDYWAFSAGLAREESVTPVPNASGGFELEPPEPCQICFSQCTRPPQAGCEAQDFCIERHCEFDARDGDFCECAAGCIGPEDASCLEPWLDFTKCISSVCTGTCQ